MTCIDTLVSFSCQELVAVASCNFLALLRCCVEDNYVTEILPMIATHDSDLSVVQWGYCGKLERYQDVLRHLDEFPLSCRILD